MARFLSAQWLGELDEAARSWAALHAAAGDGRFVVELTVRGAPGGAVTYHLRLGPGGPRVVEGPATAPDLALALDYATAVGIARGALNAQQALAAGTLHLRGALDRLAGRHATLVAVDDVFAALRARTEFP